VTWEVSHGFDLSTEGVRSVELQQGWSFLSFSLLDYFRYTATNTIATNTIRSFSHIIAILHYTCHPPLHFKARSQASAKEVLTFRPAHGLGESCFSGDENLQLLALIEEYIVFSAEELKSLVDDEFWGVLNRFNHLSSKLRF